MPAFFPATERSNPIHAPRIRARRICQTAVISVAPPSNPNPHILLVCHKMDHKGIPLLVTKGEISFKREDSVTIIRVKYSIVGALGKGSAQKIYRPRSPLRGKASGAESVPRLSPIIFVNDYPCRLVYGNATYGNHE